MRLSRVRLTVDVNFAKGLEAWAVAEGLTVDTAGHVEARILRALRALASVAGQGGFVAFNNEVLTLLAEIATSVGSGGDADSVGGYTPTVTGGALLEAIDAAAARTAIGIGSSGLVAMLAASEVSAGSTYEVVTDLTGSKFLQLKRQKTYTTPGSSALTGTERGRIWANGANLDAADWDTTVADAFWWDLDATNSDWTTGACTAPHYYSLITLNAGDRLTYTVRIANDGNANHELAGIAIAPDSLLTTYTHLWMGHSGTLGTPGVVVGDSVYGTTQAGVTVGQRNAGVWLRVVLDGSGIYHYYNTTNQDTPPTGAWTRIRTQNVSTTAVWWMGQPIRVCLAAITANTANSFTISFLYEDVQFESGEIGRTGRQWGAALLDTTATEQLIAEVNFGASVALDQTRLRAILADAVNTRPGDTATVTFSLVSSATTAPASGTYYAANAMVVPAAGRYYRLYAKIASATGVEQGSVNVARIALPIAA